MNFAQLVERIEEIHTQFGNQAFKAVNTYLTGRNWFVGLHIKEYELEGSDRAKYGTHLYQKPSEKLAKNLSASYIPRYLQICRQLYFGDLFPFAKSLISQSPIIQRNQTNKQMVALGVSPELLLERLSFTHFIELIKLDPPLKRAFYEIECVRGTWAVRELKRQIASLYYERSGLSHNKKKLIALIEGKIEHENPALTIRDPYVFEFLGVRSREVMPESKLENALLDKLEEFLLELGRGFCFEARQRRILIGGEHFFVDLVFYHRILKCHVLIELKSDGFSHEYLGQLNTYVSWYGEHEMSAGDNPPIGILLCTQKNQALVKYALAGMNSQLFVSKYQLELPNEAEMRAFIEERLKEEMNSLETKNGNAGQRESRLTTKRKRKKSNPSLI